MYERHSEGTEYEEPEEPSLFSLDPNERKLARRIRIQRRLEALTKRAGSKETEEIVEKTPIEKQILASIDLLEKLTAEGDEVVSSVKVANDARELERRREEQEIRRNLLKKLEEEDEECTARYREITEKWQHILASKDPLDIHAEMAAQNAKCLEILAKKDAVIAELKKELENADLKFENDLKKQDEDIDLLIERMENQIRTMAKAYRHELLLIDNVIESERKALLEVAMGKWEILYKKLKDDSREGIEKKKEIMQEYEEEMRKAMAEHQEEFRSQKIKFELEIQKLQQEVQNMKALCLMNIEKLDYNYAVLKRREDENIIVKNQQKRRINKLQDIVNDLKKQYAELEESTRSEIQKLTDQVLKAHKGILDLQEKSDYFTTISDRKYMQIWDMNIKSANELLDKILTADKIIYEQVLGLEWKPPEEKLLRKEDLPSYCGVICALNKEKAEAKKRKMISKSYKPATTLDEINLERRLLNHIIKLVSDHCDYLIEDSIQELLSNYIVNDKLVIRLDNVFEALGIKSEEELQFLLNFFLPYAYCPTCASKDECVPSVCEESSEITKCSSSRTSNVTPDICGDSEELNLEEAKLIEAVQQAINSEKLHDDDDVCVGGGQANSSSSETLSESPQILTTCASGVIEFIDDQGEVKRRLLCDKGHELQIETTSVSKALKEFVERYEFVKSQDDASQSKDKFRKGKVSVSRNIKEKDITAFWKRYRDIFSEDRERVWDILLVGLKKYHDVLKERHRLNNETESLRKQNAELQRLLKTYTTESENDE